MEWDKVLGGIALVITSLGSIYAAVKSGQTLKKQRDNKESLEIVQTTSSGKIIEELHDLAVEVRSNRIETQNTKAKNDSEVMALKSEQSSFAVRIAVVEAAIHGIIKDAMETRHKKAPPKVGR